MSYLKDPRVDAYLAELPDWQRELGGNFDNVEVSGKGGAQ
jgi:hypothetical protein